MDKSKVKLMTKIAVEDKKNKLSTSTMTGRDLGDYLFLEGFFAFIAYSIVYVISTLIMVFINIENIVTIFINSKFSDVTMGYIVLYIAGLIIYEFTCLVYFRYKYKKYSKKVNMNNKRIKILKQYFYDER